MCLGAAFVSSHAVAQSLLNAIPGMLNVLALGLFVFVLWGVLGMHIWSGMLHQRCRLTEYPVAIPAEELVDDGIYWNRCVVARSAC